MGAGSEYHKDKVVGHALVLLRVQKRLDRRRGKKTLSATRRDFRACRGALKEVYAALDEFEKSHRVEAAALRARCLQIRD